MKNLLFLICSLVSISSLAQVAAKKEVLLDENGKQISEDEFNKKVTPPGNKHTYTITETDSVVYGRLVPFREYGTISNQDKQSVIEELEKISGKRINGSQTLIINFYYVEPVKNQRPCIDHYTSDGTYRRFIKRNEDIAQFFITTKAYNYEKDMVYEDANGIIGKLLFPNKIYCGNYIIISPNGHYYKQVSEYRQDDIPKILESEW